MRKILLESYLHRSMWEKRLSTHPSKRLLQAPAEISQGFMKLEVELYEWKSSQTNIDKADFLQPGRSASTSGASAGRQQAKQIAEILSDSLSKVGWSNNFET